MAGSGRWERQGDVTVPRRLPGFGLQGGQGQGGQLTHAGRLQALHLVQHHLKAALLGQAEQAVIALACRGGGGGGRTSTGRV